MRPLVHRYLSGTELGVEAKADRSLATAADLAIEREARDYLSREFPGFGLIGEELGASASDSEYVWTIDPIDGTEAFVSGLPLFGTLLAVIRQDDDGTRTPLLGAIYLSVQDRLVIGNRTVTTIDGQPVRMPTAVPMQDSTLILGDVSRIARAFPARTHDRLLALSGRFRATHTWGDCLGYLAMLEGRAHARIEANLGVDDIAPIEPVILGAGGTVTTEDGTTLSQALSACANLGDDPSFVCVSAASPRLHGELIAALT